MKICALILAHKNPEQFLRLANLLAKKGIIVYMHVDSKCDISDFIIPENINILPKRYDCSLDSDNLVLAEIELLKTATKTKSEKYILLSGQDFPIVSYETLYSVLSKKESFIDITPCKFNWVYFKFTATNFFKNNAKKKNKFQKLLLYIKDRKMQKRNTLLYKLKKQNFKPYGGSQWWCFSYKDSMKILEFIKSNPNLVNLLLTSFTPDETFFQSIYMNVCKNKSAKINNMLSKKRNCLTYIDFGGKNSPIKKPYVAHPYFIDTSYYNFLMEISKQGFCFARKFDPTIDKEIIDMLEKIF